MKSLGKILLFLLLFSHALFGAVDARVDHKNVVRGENVTLILNVTGEDITRPVIDSLCGSDITSTGSQTSIQMLNGSYSKNEIYSYQFTPLKDCDIKPISVSVDGKTEKSNPIHIKVGAPTQTKDANFLLSMKAQKNEVYVGEPFQVTLIFKQRRDAEALDSKFLAPKLNGFWIKHQSDPVRGRDSQFIITKVVYTMAAQREGELTVDPAQIKIASRTNMMDIWGSFSPNVHWKTYYSNSIKVKVDPLPNGVNLVGDFTIDASADKKTINPNEALNVLVTVKGEGNLEDIKSFKPYVEGVSVFDEKPKVDNKTNSFTQKLAFVSDSDFEVPSFELKFFNPKTKQVVTIHTQPIKVKVNGSKAKKESLLIKREEPQQASKQAIVVKQEGVSYLWMGIAFLAGLVIGIILMLLKPWRLFGNKESVSIKDPKQLLIKLLPYKEDPEVKALVEVLEAKIYYNNPQDIDKKVLKALLKRYNIS